MNWSLADIERKMKAGKIQGYKDNSPVISKSEIKVPKLVQKEPKAVLFIKNALQDAGIEFVTEEEFSDERKFRFDIAILDKKVGIEYEGLVSTKSRHTTLGGFTRDATKYNLAASEGWRVYRYTCKNYKEFENDLKKFR